MESLYINIGSVTAGVRKKLEAKCAYLNEAGFAIRLVMVVPASYPTSEAYDTVVVDFSWANKIAAYPIIWRLVPVLEQWAIYKALSRFTNTKKILSIVMRYPIADFFLLRWIKQLKQGSKIVFEHNTMELQELKTRARQSFYYKYSLLGEKLFGSSVRNQASGIMGVTGEITREQLRRAGKTIPCKVVSNGVDVVSLPVWRGRPFDGRSLSIILLAGSEAPWHGVDILLNSLEDYKGSCQILIHLVGQISASSQERTKSMPSVIYTPTVFGAELDNLINSCHIGVGTLGIETSFLKEACTLKVREYWARGLPFILGYNDTDLMNNSEMTPFCLKVVVENSRRQSFSLQRVVEFAEKVYAIPNHTEQMRENAMHTIHYAVKVQEVATFLKSL